MATISIRGLDAKALSRLKQRAEREGSSLNSVVIRLLEERSGVMRKTRLLQKFDDLDALAGTWTAPQGREFEHDTAEFADVDPTPWK